MPSELTDQDQMAIESISESLPGMVAAMAMAIGAPKAAEIAFIQMCFIEALGAVIGAYVDEEKHQLAADAVRDQILEIVAERRPDTVGAPQGTA
jgi:hypothetical protein